MLKESTKRNLIETKLKIGKVYFKIDRVGRDQLQSYATRKGWPVELAELRVALNLG